MKDLFSKKSISPVVATALLLVVAVIGVVGFNTWFTSFSSSTLTNIETQNTDTSLSFKKLIGNILYLNSNSNQILTLLKITDSNQNIKCEFKKESISKDKTTKLLLNFNDGTAKDESFFNNSGTLYGGLNCNQIGQDGSGCDFDGLNDYISIPDDNSLDLGVNDFSINFWAKFNSSIYKDFISKRSACNANKFLVIQGFSEPRLFLHDGTNLKKVFPNYPINDSKWHNIIFIRENKFLSSYIDSILTNKTNSSIILNINNSVPLKIGNGPCVGLDGTQKYDGLIDEVSIYSKALTETEISKMYNSKKALFYSEIKLNLLKGINKIDVSSCNLTKNKVYDILGSTKNSIISKKLFVR